MTKELIERITQAREHTQLYGQVLPALWVYQPFTMNAGELFSAIEALQEQLTTEHLNCAMADAAVAKLAARVAELKKLEAALKDGLAGACIERDALAAELAEIRKQEAVSHRYRFIHPISGEPVWRDSSSTWNGQCVQEVQPLFAAPVPPVREPLSDNTIAALRQAIVQPARQVPTTNYVQPVPDHCDRITWRNRYYHLPLAAALPYGPRPTFGAIGSRDVDVAEAQRAWDKAMAAQPAQVPAGSIRLWDTQWVSIVNHDNAYNGWSTNDAVNHAVRMTERYIAANVAQNNLPPLPAAPEVK